MSAGNKKHSVRWQQLQCNTHWVSICFATCSTYSWSTCKTSARCKTFRHQHSVPQNHNL